VNGLAGGPDSSLLAATRSVLARPLAGPLLRGAIEDHVDEVLSGFLVPLAEDLGRDVDQVAVELTRVPLRIDLLQLGVREPRHLFEHRIAFGDQLHVAIFDAVVHHLHEVAGTVGADIGHARLTIRRFGGDLRQDRSDEVIGVARAARHDGGAFERALLAAGHPRADEMQSSLGQFLVAANRIGEMRVAR
jgi:hypothetical protein